MKTESRLPKVEPSNGDPPLADQKFRLEFTKADADVLASICDVCLKASGVPARNAVNLWLDKVSNAMTIANKT